MTDAYRLRYMTAPQRRLRATVLNLTLWTFQGWLTMILVAAGYAKVAEPMTSLEVLLGWASAHQEQFVRSLGWFEIGLGLTPLAPLFLGAAGRGLLLAGLAVISISAAALIVLHGLRMEAAAAVLNVFMLALGLGVIRGRFHSERTTSETLKHPRPGSRALLWQLPVLFGTERSPSASRPTRSVSARLAPDRR